MNRVSRFLFSVLAITSIGGCGTKSLGGSDSHARHPEGKDAIVVFAATSTTNALDEIKAQFAKDAGVEVRTSYASSSMLAQQIVNGAAADLFVSADEKWADFVETKAAVAQRRSLLGNRLVIVVPSDSKLKIEKPEDLLSAEVTHLALGDPEAVPAGKYAQQALTRLNLWDKMKSRVAAADDVRQALMYVETGAAEAGIVYVTDAAASKKVKVTAEIPAALTDPVRYPVLLLKRAEGKKAAELFYRYINSSEAAKVFEKFGFVVLKDSGGEAK